MVDISVATINRTLYGPNFTPPSRTREFYYRMREWHNQRRWLEHVLMDGQPSWIIRTKERIVKSILTFAANFLVVLVWLRLFPIGGDNTLVEDRAVLVASMVSGFPLNMEAIIAYEISSRVVKIDVETLATKKYDLEKSKDETRYNLKLHKLVIKVLRSGGQGIAIALELYESLHTCIDDMEAWVNEILKDLTMPDKFVVELKKAQDYIAKLQQKRLFIVEEEIILEEMRARFGGAYSCLAPIAEVHAIGATVSSELQTLITPLPATEAVQPDTVSASVTTGATTEVPRVTPPHIIMQDIGA
ncbi:hypothetical protein HAX54_048514 [Datura stramonium]|uniref:SMODS and SLOG-associating 2TM effector domain-containing protein n=1 Tax=Datura stramonium TaxID=4076 RepID=A0ABS8SUE6_DATST|nr:hypothetical protein [Datura stramonium]